MNKAENAAILVVVLFLLLFASTPGRPVCGSGTSGTILQIAPSYYDVQNASLPFSLNMTITSVTDLYAWQTRIYFENTVLNAVSASEGAFLSSAGATIWVSPIINNSYNATHGTVLLACSLEYMMKGVNGAGTLATLTFQGVGGGNATIHFDPFDTKLVDSTTPNGQPIPYTSIDCVVSLSEFHNIALTGILPWKTAVGKGFACNISVFAANKGTASETFNVTLYGNSTSIMTMEVALSSGNSTSITFVWNTSAFAMGKYNVSACAQPVPGQTNTTQNNCTGGLISVTIPGDINGDFRVNLQDLVLLANAYGSKPGGTKWNPNADINGNNIADLADLVLMATHYGQHYP
jgi:hypothetical protein